MTHDGEPDSYEYASRLATWIWEKHYKNESPHWKPLNDLLDVLTQIDNMTTGLVRAQPWQKIEPDRPHVEDDGCPTEKAVLQRFWREHQKQEPVAWADKYDLDREGHDFWVSRQANVRTGVPLYTAPPQQPERKLWLWKNFVDGRPEYWAFDNPYPTNLDNGDPQTLGQPCGYAIFKPSRDGSRGRTEEQVLREMESVSARSEREWQGLTENEIKHLWYEACQTNLELTSQLIVHLARNIEAKLKEKNSA